MGPPEACVTMTTLRALALLSLLTTLLAGCSGGGGGGAGDGLVDDDEFKGLQATQETGIIRGVIVDEAVRTVAGATIALTGATQRNTTSADSGAFGFEGLAPGTYFLTATKAGFVPVQQSAEVVAGVAEPPIVRIQLMADPAQAPYWVPYQFEGYIGCSARYFIEGRNFCGAVDERDEPLHDIELEGVPTFAQGELVWDSTQALGDELSFNWRRDDTSADYVDTEGPSPLVLQANATLLADNEVGAGQPLRTIVFTAHNSATEPPCVPDQVPEFGGCFWGVGAQVSQQFKLYVHVFYNMVPPEGWTFGADGDPPQP